MAKAKDSESGEVINLDHVSTMLLNFGQQLDRATTLPEAEQLTRKADAFRHLLKVAKFDLVWQKPLWPASLSPCGDGASYGKPPRRTPVVTRQKSKRAP